MGIVWLPQFRRPCWRSQPGEKDANLGKQREAQCGSSERYYTVSTRAYRSRNVHTWFFSLEGSEQEFDGRPISCGLPEGDEFGPGRSHALGLQQQIAQVFVAAATP